MDPPPVPVAPDSQSEPSSQQVPPSSVGESQNDSQTASDFIDSQLQLEADAREALPFSFDHCTNPLGSLRQNVYSCLTCSPPPKSPTDPHTPAGICYGCSISCHGEHTLVEIFERRNFTCDCGTTRFSSDQPCTLRIDPATGIKGPVHSQEPAKDNTYNQNFRNRFCGCGDWYEPEQQKGTMFQCIGLATEDDGGCGEDWWHPECLLGLPKDWHIGQGKKESTDNANGEAAPNGDEGKEHPIPPGFPEEDDMDSLICYKCVAKTPWLKPYGNTPAFKALKHVLTKGKSPEDDDKKDEAQTDTSVGAVLKEAEIATSKKRKAGDEEHEESASSKKARVEDAGEVKLESDKEVKIEDKLDATTEAATKPKHATLPAALEGTFSLITLHEDFRDEFCRCAECYPSLSKHPQLLEAEETYEPPVSEGGDAPGAGSVGTGSLLDRGEAALSNVDRVRAIEGVMVYNHLRDKVKTFLQPFAESGQAVGAEDIKAYFEKLRGDSEAIRAAGGAAMAGGNGPDDDNRREQSGY